MAELLEELPPVDENEILEVINIDFNVDFYIDFLRPQTPPPSVSPDSSGRQE